MGAVGPNEHCPCGSGRKYKKCHGRPAAQNRPPWFAVMVALVIALAGLTVFYMKPSDGVAPGGSPPGAPARQGQPWEYDAASNMHFDPSPGHNHWHAGPPPAGR